MGLISAALGAAGGVLSDTWRDYFYCEALPAQVLLAKGRKRAGRGSENIITNGSVLAVADGQCAIIVEQGKVSELCAQPGEYIYDNATEPSLFYGELGENVRRSFASLGRRFSFGGSPAKDQRVYFVNTRELMGNKYGTPNPVPFRVVDANVGLDMDVSIRCFGEYSYRVADPVLFYTNVAGNVAGDFTRDRIDSQLKSELLTALQPAFGRISALGVRYSALPAHTQEMADALNAVLSPKWKELRGIELVSVGVNSVNASEEDEALIKELQRSAAFRDPRMAAAHLVGAQAEAMKAAASNQATGAAFAFMGMNAAANAGGMDASALYQMGARQSASAGGWVCPSCGSSNTGKFCAECGSPKPAPAPRYRCGRCGWTPADPARPPKFCPECGDPFDAADLS